MFKSFRRCLSVFHRRLFTGFCIICLRLRALAVRLYQRLVQTLKLKGQVREQRDTSISYEDETLVLWVNCIVLF